MNNKEVLKICFVIFSIFMVLAFIEIGIKAIIGKFSDISDRNEEEKIQEEIYNSEEAKIERQIQEFINVVYKAIEEKDYEYVWNILHDTYKGCKFDNDIDRLKGYLNSDFVLGEKYTVTKIDKKRGLYQIIVGITNGDRYVSKYMTVDVENSNSCKLMFEEYISIKVMTESRISSNAEYKLKYYYESPEIRGYIFDLKNTTNENLTINFKDYIVYFYDKENMKNTKVDTINLNSGETKKFEILLDKNNSQESYMEFTVTENQENTRIQLNFSEYMD